MKAKTWSNLFIPEARILIFCNQFEIEVSEGRHTFIFLFLLVVVENLPRL
jgi:hypothetical protein